jgi:hypothetical protein
MRVIMIMVVIVARTIATLVRRFDWHIVMMKGKESLDEEHRQKSGQRPQHGAVDRSQFGDRMRQQVQQANAQHGAGDKAHRQLHSFMRQLDEQGKPTASQRGDDYQAATQDEHRPSRHRGFLKADWRANGSSKGIGFCMPGEW